MRQKLMVLLAQALLAPIAALAQPYNLPNEQVAQRLPPVVAPQPATRVSPASPLPQAIQPVRFIEAIAEPQPELLAPRTPRPALVPALTLADLEAMAQASNPSLARTAALVRAARGNFTQVGLPPNPSVGYEGQQLGSRGLAEQYGVFVGQEFVRGGKLRLNRQVAAHEVARAEQEFAAQQQRVLTDVRVAYYQVLIAQRQERLTKDLVKIASEAFQVAENLQKGKEVGRVDVLQAQLEADNAEILAQNALNRLTASWQTLSAVVGNPQLAPQPLDGNLEESRRDYDWNESLERVLTASPEIAAAMANVQRSRWAVQRAQVEKRSNVTVQGLVNWRDNGIGGLPDGNLTVGVPLPLWNRNQGGVIQARNEAAAAERALSQLELDLQNRLATVFERYSNASKQVAKYRSKILPAAQEAFDLMRRLYQGGETSYINLLTAQRTYSQTNLNYLESLRGLRTAEAEIEGLLLSGSLESR